MHPILFAEIDWNRVLIMGAIGGAVGGLIWLIQYFIKKNKQE